MPSLRAVIARRLLTATLALLVGAAVVPVASAHAAPVRTATVTTPSGLSLTVTPVRLPANGGTVRVRGKGYDPTVGIYVALCVTPTKGQQPGPCGGGVNTTGSSPASAWISSNPPPYGAALALPYRSGGRFDVRLTISPLIGDIDCRVTSCSIVTRADHLRPGERRFDLAVPVRFTR